MKNYTSKKWVYSVGVGALLIGAEAFGVTVHDVLSNGFFSSEHRGTYEYLSSEGQRVKIKKVKENIQDGVRTYSCLEIFKHPKGASDHWKNKLWLANTYTTGGVERTEKSVLLSKRKLYKEKIQRDMYLNSYTPDSYTCNIDTTSQENYTNKLRGKDTHPIGPLVMDDWFPGTVRSDEVADIQFYGTEEKAITNVVSDNEAYITRTIYQTGHMSRWFDYLVDEPRSLLRVYNMHITTDANHVYINQDINETSKTIADEQKNYTTEYTAIFNKKGRCVSEKESIKKEEKSQDADWYVKYLQSESEASKSSVRYLRHRTDWLKPSVLTPLGNICTSKRLTAWKRSSF